MRKRHVYELSNVNLEEEVSTSLKRFNSQTNKWRQWTKKPLTKERYTRVMEFMKFGIKAREEIEQRLKQEAKGFHQDDFPIITKWIFFNIITWYITHRAVSLNHRVEMEQRLRRAITNY